MVNFHLDNFYRINNQNARSIRPERKRVDKKYVTGDMIDNMTAYHAPSDEATVKAHEEVRSQVNALMHFFNEILPECPLKTHLLNVKCREVMMHANAVLACEGGPVPGWVPSND